MIAKAPPPGRADTRLIPALGAAGAARLHGRLLRDTLARARLALIELWFAQMRYTPFPSSRPSVTH